MASLALLQTDDFSGNGVCAMAAMAAMAQHSGITACLLLPATWPLRVSFLSPQISVPDQFEEHQIQLSFFPPSSNFVVFEGEHGGKGVFLLTCMPLGPSFPYRHPSYCQRWCCCRKVFSTQIKVNMLQSTNVSTAYCPNDINLRHKDFPLSAGWM